MQKFIIKGDVFSVKNYLKKNNPNKYEMYSILVDAAHFGDAHVMDAVIKFARPLQAQLELLAISDQFLTLEQSMLRLALLSGNMSVVNYLAELGISLDRITYSKVFSAIIQRGHSISRPGGREPLHHQDYVAALQFLLSDKRAWIDSNEALVHIPQCPFNVFKLVLRHMKDKNFKQLFSNACYYDGDPEVFDYLTAKCNISLDETYVKLTREHTRIRNHLVAKLRRG